MATAMQAALLAVRIPVEDLVEGNAYVIKARNAHVGIYRHDPEPTRPYQEHGFVIPRTKWDETYLFTEYDWTAEAFGTAIPLEDLGPTPEFEDDEDRLEWLIAWRQAAQTRLQTITEDAWTDYRASGGIVQDKESP